jgi:hypothetical protein
MSTALPELLLCVRHIGPRRAQRLIDGLGTDWFELIDANPERVFATLRGVGERQARAAGASWRGHRAARSASSAGGAPGGSSRRRTGEPDPAASKGERSDLER